MAAPIFTNYLTAGMAIKLDGGQVAIPLPASVAGWTKLRIGLRWCVGPETATTTLAGEPRLYVGLNAGAANKPLDVSTSHFLGMLPNGDFSTATTSGQRRATKATWDLIKRIGTTNTTGSGSLGVQCLGMRYDTSPAPMILATFLEITKGSPTYSVQVFGPTSMNLDSSTASVTATDFQALMEAAVLYESSTYSASANAAYSAAQTVAVDEATNGTLTHIYVGWDRTTHQIYINDLGVSKMA